jgi:flagellin
MDNASAELARYGAYINRLEIAANNAITAATETDQAYSKIADVDYAKATTELSRSQIISQAAIAILAQANQLPQTVLKLLQ